MFFSKLKHFLHRQHISHSLFFISIISGHKKVRKMGSIVTKRQFGWNFKKFQLEMENMKNLKKDHFSELMAY